MVHLKGERERQSQSLSFRAFRVFRGLNCRIQVYGRCTSNPSASRSPPHSTTEY